VNPLIKRYLRTCVVEQADSPDETEMAAIAEERESLFAAMTPEQRDETNALVTDIFGDRYDLDPPEETS